MFHYKVSWEYSDVDLDWVNTAFRDENHILDQIYEKNEKYDFSFNNTVGARKRDTWD